MLFHTQEFLLFFLLPLLIIFYNVEQKNRQSLLLLASYIFYGYWDFRLIPLLLFSTYLNWFIAHKYSKSNLNTQIYAGITANLLLIGVFKYFNFFGSTVTWLLGKDYVPVDIILPLGISFFTFQQISYLIDFKKGKAKPHTLKEYALYVAFFPQLIAGPIVRHNELIDQFSLSPTREGLHKRIAQGLMFLTLGLVKKIIISDSAAATSDPLFTKSLSSLLTFSESWSAVWSFSLQIYFDFSGYSDMAIGIALLFGVLLPYNFSSPYRAATIQDFWRKWHMTLSRFLRDYLYIPLGGSKHGYHRQIMALFFTMFLGGLWHGASWTFVVWGVMHGLALIVCASWQRLNILTLPKILSWCITLSFVSVVWVFFRAENFISAMNIFQGLISPVEHAGWPVGKKAGILAMGSVIVLFLPNSQTLIDKYLKPYKLIAMIFALIAFLAFLRSGGIYYEDFIYFQF